MAFKPNYRMQRADRDRAKKLRKEEKLKERQARALQRESERQEGGPAGDSQEPADGDQEKAADRPDDKAGG